MKKKVLVVLGTGGHTTEMLALVDKLDYDFEYVIAVEDAVSEKRIKKPGKIYRTASVHVSTEITPKSILALAFCFKDSFLIAVKSKASAVISSGPGFAVPLYFWAKLFGKKTVFISTASRIYRKSSSGKWLYWLANLSFIQWPEMKKHYPRAVYRGRLL